MELRSKIYRTESIFWRETSSFHDRGEYLVIETPAAPRWYWGNLLIFPSAPGPGDFERWNEMFDRELGGEETVHRLFAFESPADGGDVEPFRDVGYTLEETVTLIGRRVVPPPHPNAELEVREIEIGEYFDGLVELQVRCRQPRFSAEAMRAFYTRSFQNYRRLTEAGRGAWYGAFLDSVLAGSLGLFREGELGRFQQVGTDPDFRRRGVCGTLVYEVSRRALAEQGIETLVMVADENYHAARIYRSVGFEPEERTASLILYPEDERSGDEG